MKNESEFQQHFNNKEISEDDLRSLEKELDLKFNLEEFKKSLPVSQEIGRCNEENLIFEYIEKFRREYLPKKYYLSNSDYSAGLFLEPELKIIDNKKGRGIEDDEEVIMGFGHAKKQRNKIEEMPSPNIDWTIIISYRLSEKKSKITFSKEINDENRAKISQGLFNQAKEKLLENEQNKFDLRLGRHSQTIANYIENYQATAQNFDKDFFDPKNTDENIKKINELTEIKNNENLSLDNQLLVEKINLVQEYLNMLFKQFPPETQKEKEEKKIMQRIVNWHGINLQTIPITKMIQSKFRSRLSTNYVEEFTGEVCYRPTGENGMFELMIFVLQKIKDGSFAKNLFLKQEPTEDNKKEEIIEIDIDKIKQYEEVVAILGNLRNEVSPFWEKLQYEFTSKISQTRNKKELTTKEFINEVKLTACYFGINKEFQREKNATVYNLKDMISSKIKEAISKENNYLTFKDKGGERYLFGGLYNLQERERSYIDKISEYKKSIKEELEFGENLDAFPFLLEKDNGGYPYISDDIDKNTIKIIPIWQMNIDQDIPFCLLYDVLGKREGEEIVVEQLWFPASMHLARTILAKVEEKYPQLSEKEKIDQIEIYVNNLINELKNIDQESIRNEINGILEKEKINTPPKVDNVPAKKTPQTETPQKKIDIHKNQDEEALIEEIIEEEDEHKTKPDNKKESQKKEEKPEKTFSMEDLAGKWGGKFTKSDKKRKR